MFVYVNICVVPEKSAGFPGSCELPNMVTGNHTLSSPSWEQDLLVLSYLSSLIFWIWKFPSAVKKVK